MARIHQTLHTRNLSGGYPVHSLTPTDNDIGTEFSVSRYTAREAIHRGLVMR